MKRLAVFFLPGLLLFLATPGSADTIDLVDGNGTLTWDTDVSVASASQNTSVTHPLFAANPHPHEGWFLYIEGAGLLHEFTAFSKTTDGANQDVVTSTWMSVLGEPFTLELTYGINATGPDGLPALSWSASLSRPLNPASPFPVLSVRLFNVYDYDIGLIANGDTASTTQTVNSTVVDILGSGGEMGQRGAYLPDHYTVDTLANVLSQIQGSNILNDTTAAGAYNVAGAFEWDVDLCSAPGVVPECSGSGSGSSLFGGFGGFGASSSVPEPSIAVLLVAALLLASRARGRPRSQLG